MRKREVEGSVSERCDHGKTQLAVVSADEKRGTRPRNSVSL